MSEKTTEYSDIRLSSTRLLDRDSKLLDAYLLVPKNRTYALTLRDVLGPHRKVEEYENIVEAICGEYYFNEENGEYAKEETIFRWKLNKEGMKC